MTTVDDLRAQRAKLDEQIGTKKACTTIDMQQHMVYYQWEP